MAPTAEVLLIWTGMFRNREPMKDKADTTALRSCTKGFNKWKMLVNKCKIKVFG